MPGVSHRHGGAIRLRYDMLTIVERYLRIPLHSDSKQAPQFIELFFVCRQQTLRDLCQPGLRRQSISVLQSLLTSRWLSYSSFDDRPSRLFDGLEHIRLIIHIIGSKAVTNKLTSTRYSKWTSPERPTLFESLQFVPSQNVLVPGTLPKLSSTCEQSIISKLVAEKATLKDFYAPESNSNVFYSRKVGYFLQVLDFQPKVLDGSGPTIVENAGTLVPYGFR
jgi:hypothetical protein